eukprot:TRINITY_DN3050_c0_g1_i5.p1 TRINITY_DN3050_c0_g1~~TRINITY_DN3050_c0_g1_i5.p1  ORF type:complete len:330 (+),score=136.41 TRINITY_DN3050_c0_g1_i5:353-1342(+)
MTPKFIKPSNSNIEINTIDNINNHKKKNNKKLLENSKFFPTKGACDFCKKRHQRCEIRENETICIACIANPKRCTWALPQLKRGRPKKQTIFLNNNNINNNINNNVYVGGELIVEIDEASEIEHLIVAYKGPSLYDNDFYCLCILQTLLGGGTSFSSGGPGKGMYSNLFLNVLNRHYWVKKSIAFANAFRDCSLFGIACEVNCGSILNMAKVIHKEMLVVQNKISDIEFLRAKNQLKSSLFMQLEMRSVLLDDLGRQLLYYNQYISPQEHCIKIDSIEISDLQRVVTQLLASPPTIIAASNQQIDLNKLKSSLSGTSLTNFFSSFSFSN